MSLKADRANAGAVRVDAGGAGARLRGRTAYVLAALVLLNAFSVGDRAIIAIVQEPIKREFGLSDLQLGLLSGPAFALVYTLLGLPIARVAERRNRAAIVAAAMALWSAMTALCGAPANYVQLIVARMGVGVGESGFTAPALSLIADQVPAERRAFAISVFSLGQPLGAVLLSVIGGIAAQALGWRAAFWVLGLPGLVLAAVFFLTVQEPPRSAPRDVRTRFGRALLELLATPTFRWTLVAGTVAQLALAVLFYGGSYLIRLHGLGLAQVAVIQNVVPAIVGSLGILAGGILADRLGHRYPRAVAVVPAIGLLLAGPLWALAFLSTSLSLYIALFLLAALLQAPAIPLVFAIGQSVADPRSRATASAVILLGTALLGQGVGAPLIGAASDALSHLFLRRSGIDPAMCATAAAACAPAVASGLRWALAGFACLFSVAGLLMLAASRTLLQDHHRQPA